MDSAKSIFHKASTGNAIILLGLVYRQAGALDGRRASAEIYGGIRRPGPPGRCLLRSSFGAQRHAGRTSIASPGIVISTTLEVDGRLALVQRHDRVRVRGGDPLKSAAARPPSMARVDLAEHRQRSLAAILGDVRGLQDETRPGRS